MHTGGYTFGGGLKPRSSCVAAPEGALSRCPCGVGIARRSLGLTQAGGWIQ